MTTVYIYLVILVLGISGVSPCGPGLYGEHCGKHCDVNCRAHVDKQRYCDKDTGDCSLGCVPERWGSQCNFLCSKNCVDRVCVQQTGQCSKGCTENFRGHLCEEYIETRPETLTTVQPRNDPPEETHSHKALTGVAVPVAAVAVISVIAFVVNKCRLLNEGNKTVTFACICCHRTYSLTTSRHRKSGTSTTELPGADGEETKRRYPTSKCNIVRLLTSVSSVTTTTGNNCSTASMHGVHQSIDEGQWHLEPHSETVLVQYTGLGQTVDVHADDEG